MFIQFTIVFLVCIFIAAECLKHDTSTISGILDSCYEHLESNLCTGTKWKMPFHFYRPANEKYSSDQWLWDSGSHQIVWANRNVTNSILDMRTMLQMQQSDGRIPEEIFWSHRTPEENAMILLQYSNTKFTDTTQMPVLPYSLRSIYEKSGKNRLLLKEFLYPLVNYFSWWRSTRDLGDGLVVAIHNWETGLDASPAYDPAFHVYITELNDSSLHSLYPKFIELAEAYKFLYRWNTTAILSRAKAPARPAHLDTWFMMKDLALNSVYASGWSVLGKLALELADKETADLCNKEAKVTSDAIHAKMFRNGRYTSLFIDSDGVEKASVANTVQNLFPILLSELPSDRLAVIMKDLTDPAKFSSPFAVPTVAMDDPQFSATFDVDLMWRGPVWGFTNWFLLEGLGLHGQLDVQKQILTKWVDLVKLSGIYEHYNPLTGAPYGPAGLGMSTLVCDWIYRYGWDKDADNAAQPIA